MSEGNIRGGWNVHIWACEQMFTMKSEVVGFQSVVSSEY
jgi:hypothetical protein